MATLGELKARIIAETNRDDLEDELANALTEVIKRSIEYFANERFFFTEALLTATTTASNEYVALPSRLRFVDYLAVKVGSNKYPLRSQSYNTIEQWNGYATTAGQPTDYSISQDQVRLYPVPNTAYELTFLGVANVEPALDYSDDNSTNAWLEAGYDLIAARVRYILYRDYFRDAEGAQIAFGAQQEAQNELANESSRKLGTGRIKGSW